MKNLSLIIGLFLSFFFFSCSQSETESKGVNEVSQLYGCEVKHSFGMSTDDEKGKRKYFKITLNNGNDLFKNQPLNYTAGNASLILFQNLSTEEKEKYTHIFCAVNQEKDSLETEIATSSLALVENKLAVCEKVHQLFANKNYEGFLPMLSPTIGDYNKETLFAAWENLEKQNGAITGFQTIGYQFSTQQNMKLVEIRGILKRANKDNTVSIVLSQDPTDDYIYTINF